jgi:hypothetical protein
MKLLTQGGKRLALNVRKVLILVILLEVNADSSWDRNICHQPGPIGRRGLCMKESPFLHGGKKSGPQFNTQALKCYHLLHFTMMSEDVQSKMEIDMIESNRINPSCSTFFLV